MIPPGDDTSLLQRPYPKVIEHEQGHAKALHQHEANEAGDEFGQERQKTPTAQARESRADGESKPGSRRALVMAQDEGAPSEGSHESDQAEAHAGTGSENAVLAQGSWPDWQMQGIRNEASEVITRRRRTRRRWRLPAKWIDHGRGRCVRSGDGKEPDLRYFHGVGEEKCTEECHKRNRCDDFYCCGYSLSGTNCILWGDSHAVTKHGRWTSHTTGLESGGVEWGGAHCMEYQVRSRGCMPRTKDR